METEKSCCATKAAPEIAPVVESPLKTYRPVIVIFALSLAGAAALSGRLPVMQGVMGLFLLFFAALKFFDLKSFAAAFAQYDLLAKRLPAYAAAYPFIEAGLGTLYLTGAVPRITGAVTLAVMLAGIPGIVKTIVSKKTISCACVGTGFSLPVGYVTLAENTIMAAMGAAMMFNF